MGYGLANKWMYKNDKYKKGYSNHLFLFYSYLSFTETMVELEVLWWQILHVRQYFRQSLQLIFLLVHFIFSDYLATFVRVCFIHRFRQHLKILFKLFANSLTKNRLGFIKRSRLHFIRTEKKWPKVVLKVMY